MKIFTAIRPLRVVKRPCRATARLRALSYRSERLPANLFIEPVRDCINADAPCQKAGCIFVRDRLFVQDIQIAMKKFG
ncbi:MAG: hypothetical protein II916_06720 [Oscillospiraceae bacterium]|nr:hypothetical protein [Oscillospiraceae bacterium]